MTDDPYFLITVTYGGEIRQAGPFASLEVCEQAKSIALTGHTIEENRRLDEEYRAILEREMEEQRLANAEGRPYGRSDIGIVSGPHDLRPVIVRGEWVRPQSGDVKYAECVRLSPGRSDR